MDEFPAGFQKFTLERRAQLRAILRELLRRDAPLAGAFSPGEPLRMSAIEFALQHLIRGWDLPDVSDLPQNAANALRAFELLLRSPGVPPAAVDAWLQENLVAALHWEAPPFDPAEGHHTPADARNHRLLLRAQALFEELALPPELEDLLRGQGAADAGSHEE